MILDVPRQLAVFIIVMRYVVTLFFFATTLHAQWVSPTEQSYGPYSRPSRGGRHALAIGSNGTMLLAWSETSGVPRIRIGLLDSHAQLISEITTLPLLISGTEAYAPAVSFNGESFLVAWVEPFRGAERICSVAVDATGTPIPPVVKHQFITEKDGTPQVVWDGAAWRVYENSPLRPLAMTTNNGLLATVRWKLSSIYGQNPASYWDVELTAGDGYGIERVGDRWSQGNVPPGLLAIAASGTDFAVAWATSLGVGYLFTPTMRSTTVRESVDDDVAPGMACDDERCVIAYGTTNGDVHAILVDTDDVRSPELITVAASERKEHSPLVHDLGSGRFFVSYLSDQGAADQRINGRIVSFAAPTKRRATR